MQRGAPSSQGDVRRFGWQELGSPCSWKKERETRHVGQRRRDGQTAGCKRRWARPLLRSGICSDGGLQSCTLHLTGAFGCLGGDEGRAARRQRHWSLGKAALLGVCQPALCEDLEAFSVLARLQTSWLIRPLTQNEDTGIQCQYCSVVGTRLKSAT